ncbi:photosynthetic reaction center H subunit [Anaerohalosphaera lusitana]|uniref:Photosynthetic reaction center H subunit n=1 Tax=Anaerohalosphaera lusitana TaxID=1936003 RepID=A0A1U9NRI2_9BACT|nr:PRC-barrel domain-containing protein [Anaerohalosphaera lusitana]AQT70136.1 photosynthetic reaction center H subunit [Anaerohalosphaera lusitana]
MLLSANYLIDFNVEATDGNIGTVYDYYFDDRGWKIRYVVVDTGKWLPGRKVLLSPVCIENVTVPDRVLPVELTREKVKNSPEISADMPVSKQYEVELHKYYGWAPYWTGQFTAETGGVIAMPPMEADPGERSEEQIESTHLRSIREVRGYHIHASDGKIGHVDDIIVETKNDMIRYLVVDTHNWLPGKKVIIPPQWARDIDWAEKSVQMDVDRQAVKESPEFDPEEGVNRELEIRLYDYYGRPKYWS